MNYGVIVAAGKSQRMGPTVDKAFFTLGSMPVLAYSVRAYEQCGDIDGVVLVVRKDRLEGARHMVKMFGYAKVRKVVAGGSKRQVSVSNGLDALGDDVEIVSVHDGARPCVTPALISETIKAAKRYGSGVAGVRVTDTVKWVESGATVTKTLDRSKLWAVQTPQSFRLELLRRALEAVTKKNLTVTDEALAVELVSKEVHLVPSSLGNMKITTPDDLPMAAALLRI